MQQWWSYRNHRSGVNFTATHKEAPMALADQQVVIDVARQRYEVALDRLDASESTTEIGDALLAVTEALTQLLRAMEGGPRDLKPTTD